MATAKKKQGAVAFAAGVVAAPLVGVAFVAFVVGVGLIVYASSDAEHAPDDEVVFGFAAPDDIQASEVPEKRRRSSSRAAPEPAPRRTSSSRGSSAPRSDAASPAAAPRTAPSGGSPDPSPSSAPAMPPPPELAGDDGPAAPSGSLRPGAARPDDAPNVVDIRTLPPEPERPAPSRPAPSAPFSPPEVAAAEPPTRTRAAEPSGTSHHEFPEDDGPSWIPDTFRSVVNSGIALLTGGGEPTPDISPGTGPALPAQGSSGTRTAPEPVAGSAEAPEADASSPPSRPPSRTSGAAAPRPEEAPPITPSGTGEPASSVVPEASALPTTDPSRPDVPFAPAPVAPPPSDNTFDNLIAGGLDLVTGKGAPVVAVPQPTRTRTRTEMEEDVAGYTDPTEESSGTPLALEEENYALELEEHDVAASFGTTESESDVDITEALELDDIVIPVRIRTATPGVPVSVDGKALGVSPARSDLSDDDHTVVLGSGADATTFTIAPMSNPDVWCFDTKSSGGYRQVPCD